MKIYDESSGEELKSPSKEGYTYEGKKKTGTQMVVLAGSTDLYPPNGLRQELDVYEDCLYFHAYTDDEKASKINNKISELSKACSDRIYEGASIQLSDGSFKSFTYSLEDQTNITSMFMAVSMGATSYSYHENDGNCTMYSAEDIIRIYGQLTTLKTSQLTYFNQLKQYVKSLTTVSEVESVTYGQELSGEYLEKYNEIMKETNEQNALVLSKVTGNILTSPKVTENAS